MASFSSSKRTAGGRKKEKAKSARRKEMNVAFLDLLALLMITITGRQLHSGIVRTISGRRMGVGIGDGISA